MAPFNGTVFSEMNTCSTCFGLTARTSISDLDATSDAVANISMPYVWHIWDLVFWLGAQAMISSLSNTPFAMSPAMRASAILPAPMKPILAAMERASRTCYNSPSEQHRERIARGFSIIIDKDRKP